MADEEVKTVIVCCGNCEFYNPTNDKQGECRQECPKLFIVPSKIGGMQFQSMWPLTQTHLWCGKWENAGQMKAAPIPEPASKVIS